jgi:hypothetical protein
VNKRFTKLLVLLIGIAIWSLAVPNGVHFSLDTTGKWMPQSLSAACHSVYDRVEKVVHKYGGQLLEEEGHTVFSNRPSARQAASEIAGNLGGNPKTISLKQYDATDKKWWYGNSNKVISKERLNPHTRVPISYWRDD